MRGRDRTGLADRGPRHSNADFSATSTLVWPWPWLGP
jgi:hypothetical protein